MSDEDLICPITLDLLEDPVQLPCCGRAISRKPIIDWLKKVNICPVCKTEIKSDLSIAPKIVNLAYQVEEYKKKQGKKELKEIKKDTLEWKGKIYRLISSVPTATTSQTIIGQLNIINKDSKLKFQTLLIPVIDKSGSMSGKPITQAIYSLNRILDLTYNNSNLHTSIVLYSDGGTLIDVDTTIQKQNYHDVVIREIAHMGGTNFSCAFNEITKICNIHNTSVNITNAVIIFLTDGEDSAVGANDRKRLVDELKTNLNKVWTKPITIHTVGFGTSHDYEFLNSLRKIGTSEGAYRYANPNEDDDSLSNKINSILNVVVQTSTIPIKLTKTDLVVLDGENGKYWIDLTKSDIIKSHPITFTINGKEETTINATFEPFVDSKNEEEDKELWDQWYSYLIDKIASEISELSKNKFSPTEKSLFCELLIQRSRAIMLRLDSNNSSDPNVIRLNQLLESINSIKSGTQIDEKKISDLMFEGKYATRKENNKKVHTELHDIFSVASVAITKNCRYDWKTLDEFELRCTLPLLVTNKNENVIKWINENNNRMTDTFDDHKSNILITLAYHGRCTLLKYLLENKKVNPELKNDLGYNATDVAIVRGFWKSLKTLLEFGVKPSINSQLLLQTCISGRYNHKYYLTADVLIDQKLVTITEDMVNGAPSNEASAWLSRRYTRIIPIDVAIMRGLVANVKESISSIKYISWLPYLEVIVKPLSSEHVQIFEMLLENKKIDPNEELKIIDSDGNKEITCPFFIACEKNNRPLFDLLIKYMNKKYINWQNLKKTSPLWIASCNRHIDIVMELINMKADVNLPNINGDGPLIPCSQRGSLAIAELLLASGAKLSVYNHERDNPILIASHGGHDTVLDLFLNSFDKKEKEKILNQYAEIDGFVPLMASTELDRSACIRVCVKHGADIETRTKDDNKILAGATPIHLAAYYGRLNALRTLCELGGNYTSKTTVDKYNPLHIALKQGHHEIVRYLINIDKKKININSMDKNGKYPIYYANMNGNESIFEEFFVNKLVVELEKVLKSDQEIEKKCTDIIIKHGQSLGCYNYQDIMELNLGDGETLLMHAILNNNRYLYEALKAMGANFNKRDDYGTCPAFWASLVGMDKDIKVDTQTQQMLDKITSAVKQSVQNKLLLTIQTNNRMLPDTCSLDQLTKMSCDSLVSLDKKIVINLEKSKKGNHSLLGFMEKLKANKLITTKDSKDNFEYILWRSKIHLFRTLATSDSKLEPIHILALYMYSGNMTIFNNVNMALANWSESNPSNQLIYTLYQGISLLPPFVGEVYRAVKMPFSKTAYSIGTKMQWNIFAICSKEYRNCVELINQKQGIIYIIQSKTGRDISAYSKTKVDSEVVYNPGTMFVVKNLYKPDVIALGQSNIRTVTFTAEDRDIEKAEAGKNCIIVELEEI